ncbi:hypothetical protein CDAR_413931 [Caerostris darwini]|uniref:Uncharacterized protein n=1 Tax=Caerostris darwini TaxID=1538125 RepID=A0AAV4RCR2_9ARAC|nr:hypothetical protein CDAR_413931 [Caerostris darwini]
MSTVCVHGWYGRHGYFLYCSYVKVRNLISTCLNPTESFPPTKFTVPIPVIDMGTFGSISVLFVFFLVFFDKVL